ncbi:ABC transporter substrate-binding protein [Microbacterium marinilacus]|uniref:ABC transporter substrate-binding protein n=1 Tax=Microbacterium marinilacus TaxID=415209 RepID=A0ABP7BH32_9MICO|nr:ABC transporter substrate-binding protein [Microbacterium marinilacus]MBY0689567.1 ABC transporter substrate-binding protein [Microbacterium marinilacus]
MKIRDLSTGARLALVGIPLASALALTSCAGGDAPAGEYAEDGSFVFAISTDIGSLDPHLGATSAGFAAAKFAYDPLVNIGGDGSLTSGLAEEWEVDGTTVTFTLRDDVTCDDGSEITASTVKGNLDYIGDPANASPLLGAFVPAGATVEADDEAGTVTLTLASPSPFVVEGLAQVGMICDAGLADRSTLVEGTNGSGPFVISDVASNDHYTYAIREGYAWGPDGATTAEEGMPAIVEFRVVPNETTAANLLLSGDINAARIIGPDAARLEGKEQFSSEAITGETWFNQAGGRVTADLAVRTALTQALDLDELANVITSGTGKRATQLAVAAPAPCVGGDFTSALPEAGAENAAATLEDAGWTRAGDGWEKDGQALSVTFIHDSALAAGGSAAAELVVAAWTELGVQVDASTMPTDELSGVMFGGGEWDVIWEPLNVNTPDQLMGFLTGAGPADGGVNFASIANADYEAKAAEAMQLVGTDSCDTWFEAEAALTENLDVLAFANNVLPIYAEGAEFSGTDAVDPTTIRVLP